MFNGIIQTILVAFSMKMSRACTDMLSSENDYFKFLKTVKYIKSMCITCTIVPGFVELFYLSKPVPRWPKNMNIKVAIELYYIVSKISKFRYW